MSAFKIVIPMRKLINKTIYTVVFASIAIACDDGLDKFPVDKPSSSTMSMANSNALHLDSTVS